MLNLQRLPRPELIGPSVAEFIKKLAEMPEVKFILLFGSRAIGDAEEHSDVDISISAPGISRQRWLEMKRLADEAPTLLRITLIHFESSPPILQQRNLRDGVIIYESA